MTGICSMLNGSVGGRRMLDSMTGVRVPLVMNLPIRVLSIIPLLLKVWFSSTSSSTFLVVCCTLPCYILQIWTLWTVVEMISLKNSSYSITQPPLVFIIFFLLQEINLLFRALGLLQNSQKFTPAPSVTAHSLITHLITIKSINSCLLYTSPSPRD